MASIETRPSDEEDSDYAPDIVEEISVVDHVPKASKSVRKKKLKKEVDDIWEQMKAQEKAGRKRKVSQSLVSLVQLTRRKKKKKSKSKTKGKVKKKRKKKIEQSSEASDLKAEIRELARQLTTKESVTLEKTVKYAGKDLRVTKVVDANSAEATAAAAEAKEQSAKRVAPESKLDDVLVALQQPKSISTVEKSSYDWDKFKNENKLNDELAEATKTGYLEKQDFLNRVDHRQFELEKQQREVERVKRMRGSR